MTTQTVDRETAGRLIDQTDGKIFTAVFVKKDQSTRVMRCRTRVRKHVTGKGLKFTPADKGLRVVYDMAKAADPNEDESKAYRMINLNTLQRIQIGGTIYEVTDAV